MAEQWPRRLQPCACATPRRHNARGHLFEADKKIVGRFRSGEGAAPLSRGTGGSRVKL